MSLLVTDKGQPPQAEHQLLQPELSDPAQLDDRVIYVAYDVNDTEPAFHILDPDQTASYDDGKVLSSCELYPGPSLLVPQPALEGMPLEHIQQLEHSELELASSALVLDDDEHIEVTDEQGNPLHFTMQDGTRLAITSTDGKSLQVVTQDGQTIPVEINGFAEEEGDEPPAADTIVHQLKGVEMSGSSPVTHYFTIV